MALKGIFIDANLLVLLVVGATDQALIAKHRRLRRFAAEDYGRLLELIERAGQVFLTPNTLTEASNLLAQHPNPERSRFFAVLRRIINNGEEIVVASKTAARNNAFARLGLTDAALLEVVSEETPLVTVDLALFAAAFAKGQVAALNFTHLQAL